jgi:ABC-type nitrate/sulfonate/bicarbonate transport system permease component
MREGAASEGWAIAIGFALFVAGWQALGLVMTHGHAVIPTPSAILAQYARDADVYPAHLLATLRSACAGFAIGNAVAILAAIAFCRFPLVERLFRGVNIALFTMPAIVIGPIFVLIFPGQWPQILLAAVLVYFPAMASTLVGLSDVDPRLVDLIHVCGGGENALMWFVRLRSSLPSLLAGLKVAASLAVLGAILGEFGSGDRWGLGAYLLGSLRQGNAARLWGIGLAATALALAGYGVFAFISAQTLGATRAVTLAGKLPDEIGAGGRRGSASLSALAACGAILLPFALWGALIAISGLSPIIAPGPIETLRYVFFSPDSASARATLLQALGETVPYAGLGMLFGILTAFLLATIGELFPRVAPLVLPVALVAQNMPLVALVPVVLVLFGRDTGAAVFMAGRVVFFPAFVLLLQGFALTPRAARDLVRAYGGGRGRELILVAIPYAARYLFTAAKLVAPQALLGVMVSEWLLSGRGLGNLLNVSRGTLDYGMIWAGAVASILVSVVAYEAVGAIEALWGRTR